MATSWPKMALIWPQDGSMIMDRTFAPRCFKGGRWRSYDGLKLAQDGSKLASRWFHDGLILPHGPPMMALFCLMDRIFAPRSLKVGRRWSYDGSKVAHGGRKWLKLDRRRIHDGSRRPQDGHRWSIQEIMLFICLWYYCLRRLTRHPIPKLTRAYAELTPNNPIVP